MGLQWVSVLRYRIAVVCGLVINHEATRLCRAYRIQCKLLQQVVVSRMSTVVRMKVEITIIVIPFPEHVLQQVQKYLQYARPSMNR